MTLFQKERVRGMRNEGKSYSKIAVCLGLSENTIKSYCKRNNLGGVAAISSMDQLNMGKETFDFCKNCNNSIEQQLGRKPRKFCSDECRMTWWNSHMDLVSQKSIYPRAVTIIPATTTPFSSLRVGVVTKKRVAAYARVSTDTEEQLSSYEAQVDYYTRFIQENENWDFIDVYTDEGISATNTKRRSGFKRQTRYDYHQVGITICTQYCRYANNCPTA